MSAVPANLPAVERLLAASGLPLDGLRAALSAFVVAESEGRLVGVAGIEDCCKNAILCSVAADPAWRSPGLGRALVTHIMSDAEARGSRALHLLTGTAERYRPSFVLGKRALMTLALS